ncbi:MAG TPA: microcin C ABC transporter permease YejB [Gammaproteobacteria bacterium]|nr:microcin C ABC transporter permease YejB [Gammaproteobacteria bacterium]
MLAYVGKRFLLMIPTLFGILLINFAILQIIPGGPVEQMMAKLKGHSALSNTQVVGHTSALTPQNKSDLYRGAKGIEPRILEKLKKQYGFDQPWTTRFWMMLKNYAIFDLGESYTQHKNVSQLIIGCLPVSISLGLWSTLLMYLISIPLGIKKAVKHGSTFDRWSSFIIILGHAVPVFLLAILLIILFAGGHYVQWFPLKGLISDHFESLSWWEKIIDYFWHITLPTLALTVGSFATLTVLTKNSFLEEIRKQYVTTAYAKGLNEKQVLKKHVFQNAMLIIIASFPATFIGMFFTGSLLIEIVFSLKGLGYLGYHAAIARDYPVMMGSLYIFTLLGLILNLISDLVYTWVDPRIHFDSKES